MSHSPEKVVTQPDEAGERRLPAQLPPIGWRVAQETAKEVLRETRARPAPLGLAGFGLTTVLLSLHNAGLLHLGSAALAAGIALGGALQLAGAVAEWRAHNRFAAVAFGSYGIFWLSLVALLLLPRLGLAEPRDHRAMAAYLFVWGLFTLVLFFGTLRTSVALMATFFLLAILFMLLAFADATQSADLLRAAGWEGIVTGLAAIYLGAAETLNRVRGRQVLPTGEMG